MRADDDLVLIGTNHGELGASLYLRECLGREDGAPPPVDLMLERKTGDFVRRLIMSGKARTVHDLSDGGLVVAAAEMALASNVGVTLTATSATHAHAFLFGEDQARYLIATPHSGALVSAAKADGLHVAVVGRAGGAAFASQGLFSLPLETLRAAHEAWLPAYMA